VLRRLFGVVLVAGALLPASAGAAPVVMLAPGGGSVRQDRFLTLPTATPVPLPARAHAPRARRRERTLRSELARLRRNGAISAGAYRRYSSSFSAALSAVRHLGGTRAVELESVVENLHAIAAAGLLTRSRLAVLFLTLDRNRQWWTSGPLLGAGQLVEFRGSELVWEYYPGQGIELQPLATFGKADGLYTAGPAQYPRLRHLIAEMVPLAARRGGGSTWEYYFQFDGGSPPWTSAMSQATGLEALTRAFKAFGASSYLAIAGRALPIFTVPPPTGVRVRTPLGMRFLQYSFAPGAAIINGFLQTLIGLYDYAQASGSAAAWRLFKAGDAEARAEVPRYDTGAWSLYRPGQEDTLDYHQLVTGFLHELCARTSASVYCVTARHFDSYLKTPPRLELLTGTARGDSPISVRFRLSKYSHVGIVVTRGSRTVFLTSASFAYGVNAFSVPPLNRAASYTIRLAATDLAGNFERIVGSLRVY
jgi:D-glucuronyl C5-epimerase C-terminus